MQLIKELAKLIDFIFGIYRYMAMKKREVHNWSEIHSIIKMGTWHALFTSLGGFGVGHSSVIATRKGMMKVKRIKHTHTHAHISF